MVLSFSEKRTIQKTISDNLSALASGGLGFSDKRKAQSLIMDGLKKLGETVSVAADSLFQQIAKGVKDTLGAMEVFNLIKKEVETIGRDVIKGDSAIDGQLRTACIKCAELADAEGLV